MTVLFRLSDLPCFNSGELFPSWLLNGQLDIQIDLEDPSKCFHDVFPTKVGTVAPTVSYTVNNMQAICAIVYPDENFKKNYYDERVMNGLSLYKG